jgi:hypothetical protein
MRQHPLLSAEAMVWISGIAAIAAVIAAFGVVGALLATTLQLQQERLAREVDYYRKLTPFLSLEVPHDPASDATLATDIYADGGGYAFNVVLNIDQTNSTTGHNTRLLGQTVLRYLREGPAKRIDFKTHLAEGFQGDFKLTFKDTFGIIHTARQAVKVGAGDKLDTTDAIEWTCGTDCRVHVIRPVPPPGYLPRLAQWLRLY